MFTLLGFKECPSSKKCLAIAKFAKVDVTFASFEKECTEFIQLSPLGIAPVLKTNDGAIFGENTISKYALISSTRNPFVN
jgi:glutathione S-transferase